MTYFPKKQSTIITNMVAELNHILQGNYFIVSFQESKYSLNLTQFGINSKKYLYMVTHEDYGLSYKQMISYMQGILVGLRAGLEKE